MAQLGAYLDAPTVMSLDRLQLGACSYALTVVCEQATDPTMLLWPDWQSVIMVPMSRSQHGAIRRSFYMQVTFCLLIFLEIAAIVAPRPKSGTNTLSNLLNSDNSKVTIALARTMSVFDSVCTELRHRKSPNLLHNNNLVEALALARPEYVILYFVPLHCIFSYFGQHI